MGKLLLHFIQQEVLVRFRGRGGSFWLCAFPLRDKEKQMQKHSWRLSNFAWVVVTAALLMSNAAVTTTHAKLESLQLCFCICFSLSLRGNAQSQKEPPLPRKRTKTSCWMKCKRSFPMGVICRNY